MLSDKEMQKRLFVGNYEQWANLINKRFLSDRNLQINEINNGIILPAKWVEEPVYKGGVFDSEKNFVAGFFRKNPPKNSLFGVCGDYEVNEISQSDEEVIFGGVLIGFFGHFILECLGRMWYILKNREDQRKIVFLLVREECEWFYQFFDLLDIDRERIIILKNPTQFKKVIVPDESIHSWYDYTKEYLMPYDYIRNKVSKSDVKKLYLTRSKLTLTGRSNDEFPGKYICNEQYFENFYLSKGYKVVSPEDFSIKEQMSMIAGADEIATTLGSLSHFALFCKSGAKFTILTRVDNDTLYPQCLINEARNIDWCIVDASLNFLPIQERGGGVSLLGETKYWKQFVKEKYNEVINTETWKDKLDEYIDKWCYFYSFDGSKQLINSVVRRTYELTKINVMPPETLLKALLQRIDLLESQLKLLSSKKTVSKKKK